MWNQSGEEWGRDLMPSPKRLPTLKNHNTGKYEKSSDRSLAWVFRGGSWCANPMRSEGICSIQRATDHREGSVQPAARLLRCRSASSWLEQLLATLCRLFVRDGKDERCDAGGSTTEAVGLCRGWLQW